MPKFFISNNPNELNRKLMEFDHTATVEAEYGDKTVLGSIVSLMHHGENKGNPCPCLHEDSDLYLDAIGISHFDFDTFGGILSLIGRRFDTFFDEADWQEVAWRDINGMHKAHEGFPRLDGFYAWSEEHRLYAPKDGSVMDCTKFIEDACLAFCIELGDTTLVERGKVWRQAQDSLDYESYKFPVFCPDGKRKIIVRQSDKFCNHLYRDAVGVVSHNPTTGSVTLSFAEPGTGSAREIVQVFWGPWAGGHEGIAGSPREGKYTLEDAEELCKLAVRSI